MKCYHTKVSAPPEDYKRVLVHVPFLEREDNDGIYIGWFISSLQEWRIENSPSSWEVDWWCFFPNPYQEQ